MGSQNYDEVDGCLGDMEATLTRIVLMIELTPVSLGTCRPDHVIKDGELNKLVDAINLSATMLSFQKGTPVSYSRTEELAFCSIALDRDNFFRPRASYVVN